MSLTHSDGSIVSRQSGSSRLLVSSFAFLLCLAVPLGYLYRFGSIVPFDFLANDTFYYLAITQHSKGLPFYSFDGVAPTNGFHPLWQYLLSALNWLSVGDMASGVTTVFVLSVVLVSLAFGVMAWTIGGRLKRAWLLFPLLVPGLSWVLLAPAAPDYLATWSFANGMETPLSLFLFAGALFFLCRDLVAGLVAGVGLLSFAVLARLDDVFLLAGVCLFAWQSRARLPRVAQWACLGIPVAVIGAYLVYNRLTVGVLLPSSGTAKAGFALLANLKNLVAVLLPVSSWDQPVSVGMRTVDYSVYAETAMRQFQMLYPAVVCALFLALRRKGGTASCPPVFNFLAGGILLKCAYNFAFVGIWSQGHWYFAVSVAVSNMIVLLMLDDVLGKRLGTPTAMMRWEILASVVLAMSMGNLFLNHKSNAGWGGTTRRVAADRDAIRTLIMATGHDKFVEFNDGELAWATGLQAASGLGLALDPATQAARREGHFLDALYARGYRVGVASGAYATYMQDWIRRQGWKQTGDLWGIKASEFDRFRLREVATGSERGLYMFEFAPAGSP